jgi:glutamine amidotransferase
MIAILDYGVGNLRSVQKAFERVGATAIVTADGELLNSAQGVVLPGVGAFGDAMENLREKRLIAPLLRQVDAGKPLLGICLGMQLLFEQSEEMGRHQGLGLLRGRVIRFPEGDLRVPHIGWNRLHMVGRDAMQSNGELLETIVDGAYAYFVHSFYCVPEGVRDILATTEYGVEFASVVGHEQVWGAQFHPEKSQEVGLQILANFARLVNEEGGGDRFSGN